MQAILATRTQDKLEDVAEQADRIHEVGSRSMILATTAPQKATPSAWEAQIEALRQQVATLTTEMTDLAQSMAKDKNRNRSRERQRERSRSRARDRTPRQDGICFYHRRFGSKAEKCTKPCAYKPGNDEGNR